MLKAVKTKGVKPGSRVARFIEQLRNYSTVVAWLVYTVFKGNMRVFGLSIGLNLIHLTSQAAAIGILYWYARQMEGKGVAHIPYFDISLTLKGHPEVLWMVVAASSVFFILSAFLLYYSRKLVFDIAEQKFGRSMERLALDSLELPDPRAKLASRFLIDFGLGGLGTGARRGALIASSFAGALAAVIGAIGASIFLVRVDLPLTVLIIVSAALAALFLYPLTLRAVRAATVSEKALIAFKGEMRTLFQQRYTEKRPQSVPGAMTVAKAYIARRRIVTELVLAIGIGVTIIIGAVVFYMAHQAFAGRQQWAIFIAYIGALRIVLAGATAAIQVFASVSRYYPRIVRYYLFCKEMAKMAHMRLAKLEPGDAIVLGTLQSGAEVSAKVGERIALVTGDAVPNTVYALIDAQSPQSPLPIGVTVVDSAGISSQDGAIALVYLSRMEDVRARVESIKDVLRDKVVLVTYMSGEKIGSCGEEYLLTCADSELRRFVPLGTPEAEAAIKEVAALAKKRRAYEDDEDEDADMG
jgi:hypothetical protein